MNTPTKIYQLWEIVRRSPPESDCSCKDEHLLGSYTYRNEADIHGAERLKENDHAELEVRAQFVFQSNDERVKWNVYRQQQIDKAKAEYEKTLERFSESAK